MNKSSAAVFSLVMVAFSMLFYRPVPALAGKQHIAQGSWFGRAVPIGPCKPGDSGCPLPPEMFLVLNIGQDGNFIGHDSLTFPAQHTTAHGQWYPTSSSQFLANYVVLAGTASTSLDSTLPDGSHPVVTTFAGAYRMRWQAAVTSIFEMEGFVDVYFFPFTNPFNGQANVDPDTWIPIPDPLADLGPIITDQNLDKCKSTEGCLGVFQFKIRRVNVP